MKDNNGGTFTSGSWQTRDITTEDNDPDSICEEFAALAHEQWSGWVRYMFSLSTLNPDGTLTLPKEKVMRWKRQMSTEYKDLPEEEKKSEYRIKSKGI